MIRPAAVALAVLAVSVPALAQTAPSGGSPFAELTKDMQELPGLMTFYKYKDGDANPAHDQTKLLCVVPRSLLKQDLLFAVNFSRGNLSGFQYLDGLVRWEQVGRQLTLVAPNTGIVDKQGSQFPINEAVRRTYRPSFLFALPIVAMSPGGDPVVDLGQALFSPSPIVPLPVQGIVRRDISRINEAKSFDQNVLVDVDYALSAGNGGPTVGVSFGFRKLPSLAEGYRPRLADERVGYFQTSRQDWTVKYDQREFVDRFINRWDLRKKDPTLDVSPPEKPITFILDKSIPYQWRKYVSDGVLEWNKAFEKCGIVGAMVVQQQTDDNEFADIDPADARYNFIQWTVRNTALAVGPSRADPRTGQILDADIVVDDAWIRYFNDRGEVFSPKVTAQVLGPDTLDFLGKHPEFMPPGMTKENLQAARATFSDDLMKSGDADAKADIPPALMPRNRQQCNLAIGLVSQIAMAQGLYAQAKGAGLPKVPDQVIGNALKEIITHEVGHTLGLRHNFKASSWLTLDEVRKHRDAGEPFVSSVMDYTPLAIFPDDDLSKVRSFASDSIGPYDYWAVQYGYGDPKDGQSVQQFLKGVTDQSSKKEYAYGTDEDTEGLISPDPLTNRYDLSDNPLAWAKNVVSLTDKLLGNIGDWAAKPDEPNYFLRDTFLQLAFERSRNLSYVGRLVGGQYFSRAHRSDPGAPAPLTPVDGKLQRDALALIGRTVLSQDFYKTSRVLLNRLTPSRWDDGNDDDGPAARIDFPYHRYVQAQYENTLLALCSPQTLQRVYDAEANDENASKMTAAELIRSVRDMVWSELDAPATRPATQPTDAKPLISPERRNMQDTHLQYLLATANADPSLQLSVDVQNLARYALRELADKIGKTLDGDAALDFGTRGHLNEARSRILRTLDKPLVDRGGGSQIIIRLGQKADGTRPQ